MRRAVLALVFLCPFAGSAVLALIAVREQVAPAAAAAPLPQNMAEAASIDMPSEVIRRLRFGEDPLKVYPLRPEFISSTVQYATVPEAAIWSRELEMIRLLDKEGFIVGDEMRRRLACLATDLKGIPEIVEYLTKPGDPACVPDAAMTAVLKRTSGG